MCGPAHALNRRLERQVREGHKESQACGQRKKKSGEVVAEDRRAGGAGEDHGGRQDWSRGTSNASFLYTNKN
jgi:hypothetical protein